MERKFYRVAEILFCVSVIKFFPNAGDLFARFAVKHDGLKFLQSRNIFSFSLSFIIIFPSFMKIPRGTSGSSFLLKNIIFERAFSDIERTTGSSKFKIKKSALR